MKRLVWLSMAGIVILMTHGCSAPSPPDVATEPAPTVSNTTETPTASLSLSPSATATSTSTLTPSATRVVSSETPRPTQTLTFNPPVTLDSPQAHAVIQDRLRTIESCARPCFLGIVPEVTTKGEMINIFLQLDLDLFHVSIELPRVYYHADYESLEGMDISIQPLTRRDMVERLTVSLLLSPDRNQLPRPWAAFSPENLIAFYGVPTQVEVYVGRSVKPLQVLQIHWEHQGITVYYDGRDLFSAPSSWEMCPLTFAPGLIKVFFYDVLYEPLLAFVPLQDATSLSIEDFAALMLGDPAEACFEISSEAIP